MYKQFHRSNINWLCALRFKASQKLYGIAFSVALLAMLITTGCGGGGGGSSSSQPSATSQPAAPAARTLSIPPVAQETNEWCWAASAQMVLSYYGLPNVNGFGNYQCGIVAAYYGYISPLYPQCFSDCTQCATAAIATMDREQLLINQYGVFANNFGFRSRALQSSLAFQPLSTDTVATEINAGRPIIAGISPGGFAFPDVSQHAVVIVGYDYSGAVPALIINDPFPYAAFPQQPNPYNYVGAVELQPGRYSISYQSFVSQFQWANTIYGIQ